MVLTNAELDRAEAAVLAILRAADAPYPPVALLRRLQDDQVPEALGRAAIWYLIDRNEVELTWDRHLRARRAAEGAGPPAADDRGPGGGGADRTGG